MENTLPFRENFMRKNVQRITIGFGIRNLHLEFQIAGFQIY